MRAKFTLSKTGGSVTFYRAKTDPKYYGAQNAKGEHNLFHAIKKWLNSRGFDLIKKRAWKDGHLVDDLQPYLRTRKPTSYTPHIYIISDFWALRGANEDWNEGEVTLRVHGDVWERRSDWWVLIATMSSLYADIEVELVGDAKQKCGKFAF